MEKKVITTKQMNELINQIEQLKLILAESEVSDSFEYHGDYKLWSDIGGDYLEVQSNYDTWLRSKENKDNELLLMTIGDESINRELDFALTLNQMIELRDYLIEKINFIQE